ncbi:MAG: hypothetical protein KatS3mg118_3270 [Paracoccaceae bacterium]|nr:MAG: hypothetical protein KatS3mg118_3270 [Paracoccaceae bacterium]
MSEPAVLFTGIGILIGVALGALGAVLMRRLRAGGGDGGPEAEALRHELDRLRRVTAAPVQAALHAADALVLQDMRGRILWCNPAFAELTGWSEAEVIGRRPQEFLLPPEERPAPAALERFRYRPDLPDFQDFLLVRNVTRGGEPFWNQVSLAHVPGEEGGEGAVVTVCRDVTEQVEALEEAQAGMARSWCFEGLAEAGREAMALLDLAGRLEWANPAFLRLAGAGLAELRGQRALRRILPPDALPDGDCPDDPSAPIYREARVLQAATGAGEERWFELRLRLLRPGGEGFAGTRPAPRVAAVLLDVSPLVAQERELRAARAELDRREGIDPVTGVASRHVIRRALAAALAEDGLRHRRTGLVHLEPVGLGEINGSLGIDAADAALAEFARRLQAALAEGEQLGRAFGAGFLIICPGIGGIEGLRARAEALIGAVAGAIEWQDCKLRLGARAGVALSESGQYQAALLARHAAIALDTARRGRSAAVGLFTAEMERVWTERLALRADLARAIGTDQFRIHFQPQIALTEGRVAGAEALLRWQHPERGLIAPGEFLPLARAAGLAEELDRVAMAAALDAMAALRADGVDPGRVGLNVEAETLCSAGFADRLLWELDARDLAPGDIALELPEAALIGGDAALEAALADLAGRGIAVLIDDFGRDQGGLVPFTRLPVAGVKIHAGFLERLHRARPRRRALRGLSGICGDLGREMVAMGVETPAEAERLRGLGCPLAQGHAFAPAMPPEELAGWLSRRAERAAG